MRLRSLLLISAATFAATFGSSAYTQTAGVPAAAATGAEFSQPQPSTDPAPAASTGVDDIVVTARKREERLRDVPVAVTAVTGEQLREKNITQLLDLTAVTPNFWFSNGAVQPFTFVRGFGSGSNIGFAQSVGKFADNVAFDRDQDGRIPIFDVERLEVLKGPQVLTFGNSATVGAINITTKKPGSEFEADGSVGYEFYDRELLAQGGVSVPLGEGVSFRLAGLYRNLARGEQYNALQDRHEPTVENWAVRPTLRLTPVAGLEIVLHGEYDHLREDGNAVVAVAQPLRPGALPYLIVGDPDRRDVDYDRAPFFTKDGTQNDAYLSQLDVRYDLLGGRLSSTTAYRGFHANNQFGIDAPAHSLVYLNAINQRYRQFSQELRFGGTYGALDLTVGGYYQRDELRSNSVLDFSLGGYGLTGAAATPFARYNLFDQDTTTYSGFVDATYRLTDALSVSGGVRYTDIGKRAAQQTFAIPIQSIGFDTPRSQFFDTAAPTLDPLLLAVAGTAAHNFPFGALRLDEDHWQPQAIIQYKIDATNNVYLKYVRGAKVGGFDFLYGGTSSAQARFAPEFASSFEAGVKGLIPDWRLEYAVAVFRTTYTDLQQSVFQNLVYVVSNVGKARSTGIELDLTYRPVDQLRLTASGSYLDAKYLDFNGAACSSDQNLVTPRGCFQDLSGTKTQFSSKLTGSFAADYQVPVGGGSHIVDFGASVFARTKFNAGPFLDRRMEQSGFAQIDAHIDVFPAGHAWTLSVFGRNLTDKRYLEYGVLAPGQNTAVLGSYSRGRQIGIRLGFGLK